MIARKLLITAALLAATSASAAPTETQCASATDMAVSALKARRDGVPLEMALAIMRQNNVRSGLLVWAVKQAYRAPGDVPEWMFRGALFGECMKYTGPA